MLTPPSPKLACTETHGLNFAEASAAVCSLWSGWKCYRAIWILVAIGFGRVLRGLGACEAPAQVVVLALGFGGFTQFVMSLSFAARLCWAIRTGALDCKGCECSIKECSTCRCPYHSSEFWPTIQNESKEADVEDENM